MRLKATNLLEALSRPGVIPERELRALTAWATTFYPFQREWLFEPARIAIANKARQIGASHTTGAWGDLTGVFLGETTSVISMGQRESNEVLDKAVRHARVLEKLGSRWAAHERSGEELKFASGGRIIALPASSGGRSFSGNIFLDEFAYHGNDDEKVWDGAAAVALHGYRIRIASTPNGVGNLFHKLWSDPKANKGYAKHEFLLDRALADGMKIDIDFCWQLAHGNPSVYAQFFQGAFLDGAEQYIPSSVIERAVTPRIAPKGGRRFAGMDIGLKHDLSTLIVVEQEWPSGICTIVDVKTCKRTDWPEQQALVEQSANDWGWERLCVDQTGMGEVPVQLLQRKLGKMRVEGIMFGPGSKEAMATLLYQSFNDSMVRIPRDVDLQLDLQALRRTVTSSGAVRYDAPRTERGHADRAWALALALTACSTAPLPARRDLRSLPKQ